MRPCVMTRWQNARAIATPRVFPHLLEHLADETSGMAGTFWLLGTTSRTIILIMEKNKSVRLHLLLLII